MVAQILPWTSIAGWSAVIAGLAVGCAAPRLGDPALRATRHGDEAAVLPKTPSAAPQGPAHALDCRQPVPPSGYKYGFAWADRAAARDRAREEVFARARQDLLDRFCAGGCGCDELKAAIQPWTTGEADGGVCHMATISHRDLEAWQKRRDPKHLDDSIDAMLAAALASVSGRRVALSTSGEGGEFEAFLAGRVLARLSAVADVRPLPAGWTGGELPRGVDLVLRPQVPRQQANGDVDVLWDAVFEAGGCKARHLLLTVPKCATPPVYDRTSGTAPSHPDIEIVAEGAQAGVLCEGQRTQLWLRSTAQQPLYVRVYDLWGSDGGLQAFPAAAESSDLLAPGARVALSPSSYDVVAVEGASLERLVVFAAPTREALAAAGLPSAPGQCRLAPADAIRLRELRRPPSGVRWSWTELSIRRGGSCPVCPDLAQRQQLAAALLALPTCGPQR